LVDRRDPEALGDLLLRTRAHLGDEKATMSEIADRVELLHAHGTVTIPDYEGPEEGAGVVPVGQRATWQKSDTPDIV
jgi:hypothetical protein